MGNYDEAVFLYSKVLEKNPSYAIARQNLESVLSEIPQKNSLLVQNQLSSLYENETVISEQMENPDQINLQKEKSPDFFEQVDLIFSSLVSLFNIQN